MAGKPRGKSFKKGESGNPNGRPPLPLDLKQARILTRLELERTLNKFLYMNGMELNAAANSETTTALEGIVISVIREAIRDGCPKRLDFLLDRLLGKVPIETHNTHALNFAAMPRAQVIEMGQEAVAFLKRLEKDKANG